MTNGLALHLATRQQQAMREASGRGVPRVLVDGGTLRAKVSFTTARATARGTSAPQAPARRGSRAASGAAVPRVVDTARLPLYRDTTIASNLVRFETPLRAGILDSIRDLRINVLTPRTAEPTPEDTAQIQGEVEIRFRTVT